MTQSLRRTILLQVIAAIEARPDLAGLPVVRNPRTQLTLADGARVVVLREMGDDLLDSAGQIETRRYTVLVGAISRAQSDPDADADALHESTREAVAGAVPAITEKVGKVLVREQATQFDFEALDSGGAAVFTTWVVQYRRPVSLS